MTAPTELLPTTKSGTTPTQPPSSAGQDSRTRQDSRASQVGDAGAGTDTAATSRCTAPKGDPSLPPHFPADHSGDDAHWTSVGGDQTGPGDGQTGTDAHDASAASGPHASATATTVAAVPIEGTSRLADPQAGSAGRDQGGHDTHRRPVSLADPTPSASATRSDLEPKCETSRLADPTLALLADVLDDLEKTRISNESRLRQLTRDEVDSDGEERGFGLDETHPDVARLAGVVDGIADLEHKATLNLNRALRAHPLGPWVKAQKGIGEKQAARLLAVVGDPYWHDTHDRPRTVSELWAYAGHGDPTRKLRKGMTQAELFRLGNPVAKSRVWLIATAVLKAGGGEEKALAVSRTHTADASLAATYYHRKRATEGREHATECKRCGPSGKPALPGSPWSDAHRHADALRILGKQILRDLWLEAKRIHELPVGQGASEAQSTSADGDQTGGDPGHPSREAQHPFAGVASEAVAS